MIKNFIPNPVLIKEIRVGMRNKKIPIIIGGYLLILSVFTFFYFIGSYDLTRAGSEFFGLMSFIQWTVIILISPSLTCMAFSGEKEKKTLDFLIVSPMTAGQMISGKLLFALSIIALLLASSFPIAALVFLLGGVSPSDIFINLGVIMIWGIFACTLSIFFSSKNVGSSVSTYLSYIVLIIVYFFSSALFGAALSQGHLLIHAVKPFVFYYIAIIAVLFGLSRFYHNKTSNNIRPDAGRIIQNHYLFMIFYFLTLFIFYFDYSTSGVLQNDFHLSFDSFLNLLLVFVLIILGNFIDRKEFPIPNQERIFNKSITSKQYFFPLFFALSTAVVTLFYFFNSPEKNYSILLSLCVFCFFILVALLFTDVHFHLFDTKIRPIYIYYGFLFIIMVFPLAISIIYTDYYHSFYGSDVQPMISLTFIQPIFALTSVWRTEMQMVNVFSVEYPTYVVSFVFYSFAYLVLSLTNHIVRDFRRKREKTGNRQVNPDEKSMVSGRMTA